MKTWYGGNTRILYNEDFSGDLVIVRIIRDEKGVKVTKRIQVPAEHILSFVAERCLKNQLAEKVSKAIMEMVRPR